MRRKPWPLVLLALFHVFAPLGNLYFNSFRMGVTPLALWNHWIYVLPAYHLLINVILPVIGGLLIFICRRWSYWLYIFVICIIFAVSMGDLLLQGSEISPWSLALRTLTFIGNVGLVSYVVVPSIRNVYLDPRLRWWEAAPRYMYVTDISVDTIPGMTINISKGGLFLTCQKELNEGELITLDWQSYNLAMTVVGKVVYKSLRPSSAGYGVQFQHTSQSKKTIKKLIRILHSENQLDASRRPRPEESFLAWASKLLTTGKGLFPKS